MKFVVRKDPITGKLETTDIIGENYHGKMRNGRIVSETLYWKGGETTITEIKGRRVVKEQIYDTFVFGDSGNTSSKTCNEGHSNCTVIH